MHRMHMGMHDATRGAEAFEKYFGSAVENH